MRLGFPKRICLFLKFLLNLHSFLKSVTKTGVAQLVEQWSPKPKVVSSNLTTRAKNQAILICEIFLLS